MIDEYISVGGDKVKPSDRFYRKIIAGFFTVIIFTFGVSIIFVFGYDAYESLGSGIIGISLVIAFYTTPVILLYGIPVSLLIEYVYLKHLPPSNALFIGMHSIFGMAGYFLFWEWGGVVYGVVAATILACTDRLLASYRMTDKLIIASIVIPIGLYAVCTILIAAIG